MDSEYDVVVCGTGLKECILSGLLSVHGYKVLHVDRNPYYGGESASLNLTSLFAKFRPGQEPPPEWGANRDWNVDLIPKFVMAGGKLVNILLKTKVTRYLEWKVVDGTHVFQPMKGGWFTASKQIHKVPATDAEALKSPMLGAVEKMRCVKFFNFCANWDDGKSETHQGFDPMKTTMSEVYAKFGLQENTIDFIGHALALYTTDEYMDKPMGPTVGKLRLYMTSLARYGQSPFIYPLYGLGGLPEGFSRLSAVHGGVYMLSTPIESFIFENGKVAGVKGADGKVAKCSKVVCDPSYVGFSPNKVRKVGQVIRVICILNKPIPETDNVSSCQIILPQKQLKRKHDIYITLVSAPHGVCKQGKYIGLVSTDVETTDPMKEISLALSILGNIEESFPIISDIYEPVDTGESDQVFVTSSYDATSHFESAADDVLRMWKNISGKELDLTIKPEDKDEEQ